MEEVNECVEYTFYRQHNFEGQGAMYVRYVLHTHYTLIHVTI